MKTSKESKTRPIEFLLAYEDGTWITEVFGVPEEIDPVEWAHGPEGFVGRPAYRKVVLVAVYSETPDEGKD